jgi:WD40 repeat protein
VIRLVDAKEGTQLQTLETPGASYSQLAFSPDGRDLAAGGTSGGQVHVAVWDLRNGQVVHRWDWPKGRDPHCSVESLCFAPNGKRLAAAVFRQSSACLWDLTTGEQIVQLTHGEVYGLSFSPDSKTLATAGWDKVVRLWEADTGKLIREVNVEDHVVNDRDVRMYTVCFAPRGGSIATAHLSGTVGIWDAADMKLRSMFKVEGRFIYGCIGFSRDGLSLATGNMGGNVALWDPLTAEKIRDVGRHQSYVNTVSFGRDNRTLLSGGRDGVCYLWDLQPRDTQPGKDLNR